MKENLKILRKKEKTRQQLKEKNNQSYLLSEFEPSCDIDMLLASTPWTDIVASFHKLLSMLLR